MNNEVVFIGITMVFLGGIILYEFGSPRPTYPRVEITPRTLAIGNDNPTLWLFYNTSDVNSRHWLDFGARSSHAIQIPLLNILYNRIVSMNGQTYTVRVLTGTASVAEALGGWEHLPSRLQREKARVYIAEEDWIRTAILAKFGGLWLSPYMVALRPFGPLPKDSVVTFGQDADSGFSCLWVPKAGNPIFIEWEKRIRRRLEEQTGGFQIRGDSASDWKELVEESCAIGQQIEARPLDELARNRRTNKKLELEDIFASGTEGRLPFKINSEAKYLVIPYHDLLQRSAWGWVLRMSEKQVMASDLALTHILSRGVSLN
jgi:hypothetical protein